MRNWLKSQWKESTAKSIWDLLTPFGRCTVFLPIWLMCWLAPVVVILVGVVAFVWGLVQRLTYRGK